MGKFYSSADMVPQLRFRGPRTMVRRENQLQRTGSRRFSAPTLVLRLFPLGENLALTEWACDMVDLELANGFQPTRSSFRFNRGASSSALPDYHFHPHNSLRTLYWESITIHRSPSNFTPPRASSGWCCSSTCATIHNADLRSLRIVWLQTAGAATHQTPRQLNTVATRGTAPTATSTTTSPAFTLGPSPRPPRVLKIRSPRRSLGSQSERTTVFQHQAFAVLSPSPHCLPTFYFHNSESLLPHRHLSKDFFGQVTGQFREHLTSFLTPTLLTCHICGQHPHAPAIGTPL